MINFRKISKSILPDFIVSIIKKFIVNYDLIKYKNLSNKKIFTNIYKSETWGKNNLIDNKKYNSGPGTQNIQFVNEYIYSLSNFFLTLEEKPSIADLGCGDFEIGSKLVKYSSKYFAIDVFEDLIKFNKRKFSNLNVNFLVSDITKDDLPYANVYILRTVLQHLSNTSIVNFISNMRNKCKYLIITEHLPDSDISNFKPNKDMISGPYIRLFKDSGVILTEKPFNLKVKMKRRLFLSSSKNMDGVLDTTLLEMN